MMVQRPQSEQFWKIMWVICYPFVAIGMGQNIRPWSHNILGLVSFKCSHLWPPNFDPRFVFLWNVPPNAKRFPIEKNCQIQFHTIPGSISPGSSWFIQKVEHIASLHLGEVSRRASEAWTGALPQRELVESLIVCWFVVCWPWSQTTNSQKSSPGIQNRALNPLPNFNQHLE